MREKAVDVQTEMQEEKYLTFLSDGQLFGIPIGDVVQIVGIQKITQIPDLPNYVKGVIDLRGDIIPLIDLRLRTGKQEAAYTERTCVIVTRISDKLFGFIVDEVDEVTDIQQAQISDPPKLSAEKTNRYLTGIARMEDEKIILLVDPASILRDDEIEELTKAVN